MVLYRNYYFPIIREKKYRWKKFRINFSYDLVSMRECKHRREAQAQYVSIRIFQRILFAKSLASLSLSLSLSDILIDNLRL